MYPLCIINRLYLCVSRYLYMSVETASDLATDLATASTAAAAIDLITSTYMCVYVYLYINTCL